MAAAIEMALEGPADQLTATPLGLGLDVAQRKMGCRRLGQEAPKVPERLASSSIDNSDSAKAVWDDFSAWAFSNSAGSASAAAPRRSVA